MAIKLADTLAPMADFPAAMAEHVEFADGENLQQKLDDGSLGGGGGVDGKSAYDIWLDEGNSGSEADFLNSLKGEKGDTGEKGTDGIDGYSPTVVENANNTEDNYKLDITTETTSYTTPNLKGKQGVQGLQGTRGEKGDKGEQGIQGIAGTDGVSPLITTNTANTEDVYKLDITDANGTFTTPNLVGRQGVQGIQGEKGEQGEQGIQGIQGIQGEKGEDGYPFLIYREYSSLDDFDPDHFPEIGLMFMIKAEDSRDSYPIYRYTGMVDTPYSFVTDLATSEGLKGEKGDKGDKGEQGIQGEKGADGITYTPVIGTVTTVGSISDATADIVVDSVAKTATFNFAIPKGANGAIGGKGDKGEKGDTGEKGDAGEDGTTYVPNIGTVTTVSSVEEATANVELDNENKLATFNFNIPKGVGVKKVEFTSSTLGDVAGIASATDTYTITFTDESTTTYEVYNGKDCDVQIDDVNDPSETSVWSSKKINDSLVNKQDFRIFKSLEEFNEKKGTSFTVVSGADNMADIANAMSEGDMLIITTKYITGSEIYFGLDASTGWIKMFTLTRIGGLCDIKCTTSAVKNLTRVLADSTLTDWQELATMDKLGEKLYIDNSFNASVKYVKIASAPTDGSSIDIHFKSARTNTTFEEETVRISKYVSKTVYDGKIIQKGLYAANGNKPNENEANFLVILDDYSVWAHIASYSTAEIELYSYGRKQSIDGTEATTLPSEVKYSMFNGAELATMDKVALKQEHFDKKVTLTDSNWKYAKIPFTKSYMNTPSVNISCGDYLNPEFYSYWGCEAYIININNKGCTIRYRSSKASESEPLEVSIIVFVNGI